MRTRTTRRSKVAAALVALAAVAATQLAVDAAAPQDGQKGSGGRAVAHRAGGRVVTASKAPDGRIYRVADAAIEPTLGITKEGAIFYTAAASVTGVDVLRSTDDGGTWENTSPRLPTGDKSHPITLDPYIYVAEATGRIFNIDLTVACSNLSFSDDDGETWTSNPLACGRPVNDHQTLFSGPPAISPTVTYPEVVDYCWNDFGAGSSCSKSLDGGITWVSTGSPAFSGVAAGGEETGADVCGGFHGHGVVGPDGTVYLPKEYCGQPWIGISKDEGATWTRVQVANNTTERLGSDTSVAVDAKGNLYYTYESADQRLWLVTSKDGGEHWTNPKMVGSPGVEEVIYPTIDVGDPGKIAIAYMGTEESPFAKCDPDCTNDDYAGVRWNGYITMTTNALAKDPLFYSGTVNAKNDPLYIGRCDFSNRCDPILDFIDVEIAPDGTPWGAFVDPCGEACKASGV
ncbi:MAG TPA: sialidase family protein, partial [Actinomycetota bacterium]|nr:sialidase family protein [Actinomycetota bacterium]